MSRLVDLYPRAWRARYGDELEDLAAARPLGLGGTIDLVRGAFDAHRHPELVDPDVVVIAAPRPVSRQRYEDLRVARRLGLGAIAGAVLIIIAPILALNGPIVFDGDGAYRDGMAAWPFLLGAMVLLSGGLLGHLIRLGSGHHVARTGAIVALLCGPLWAFGPWNLSLGTLMLVGLVVFAGAAWGARALSAAAALAIIASSIACVAIIGAGVVAQVDRLQGTTVFVIAILAVAPIWLAIGGTLHRLPEVDDDPAASTDAPREASTV
ncbi:MAG: hypothetical protein AB1736_02330 [Chloroflexota bacterium]